MKKKYTIGPLVWDDDEYWSTVITIYGKIYLIDCGDGWSVRVKFFNGNSSFSPGGIDLDQAKAVAQADHIRKFASHLTLA